MTEKKERDAGRELDAEIAERVFDAVVNRSERGGWGMFTRDGERLWLNADAKVPDFSSSVADAFLVVEAMRAKGHEVTIGVSARNNNAFCEMAPASASGSDYEEAATPALAICLCALAAIASDTQGL